MNAVMEAVTHRVASFWKRLEVRPATLGLLCCLFLLLTAKTTILWWRWSGQVAGRIARENQIVTTEAAIVKALPARSDSIVLVKRELIAASDSFIFAPTVAQVTTMTASLLASDATSADVRLGTIDIRADSTLHDGVRVTTVDGEASGAYAAAISFVRLLDRGSPFFVRMLALSPVSTSGQSDQQFNVRFGLIALARKPFEFER